MRRSVQPNCPRAMTCCFFVSLKMLAMPAEGPRSLPPRQRLERLLPMAVFQVSMYGRFWVSTEVTIPDAEQDKTLPDKLRAELPGILRWAVEGCRLWQAQGLVAPSAVLAATEGYKNEMDTLGNF